MIESQNENEMGLDNVAGIRERTRAGEGLVAEDGGGRTQGGGRRAQCASRRLVRRSAALENVATRSIATRDRWAASLPCAPSTAAGGVTSPTVAGGMLSLEKDDAPEGTRGLTRE